MQRPALPCTAVQVQLVRKDLNSDSGLLTELLEHKLDSRLTGLLHKGRPRSGNFQSTICTGELLPKR